MSEQTPIGDRTLTSLIDLYKTDPRSTYSAVSYYTRFNYERHCRRIEFDHGSMPLRQIQNDDLINWHKEWAESGPSIAHTLMMTLRNVFRFGVTVLKDEECERVAVALYKMDLRVARPKNIGMTVEHAIAVREVANRRGMHSIALAQALQFECRLTQKLVIGEWVPLAEPGSSDVLQGKTKWVSGIRWSDIDEHLVLSLGKDNIDLKRAPMVMEELSRVGDPLPQSGPVIVNEVTALPYAAYQFRMEWRATANAAGLPKTVQNMDSSRRGRTVPELSVENKKFRAVLLIVKDALNGSETIRSQAYKIVCDTLDSPAGGLPNSPCPSRQARQRFSLWREPRAKRSA
jgi:hypothetical protein